MLRPRLLPLAAARTPRARVIAVCCAFAAGATPSAHAQPAAQHAPASPAEPAPHPPASATQPAPLAQPSSPPAPAAAPAPSAPEDLAQARRQYEFGPEVCPFCAITPEAPAGRTGLHWHEHWKPVSTPEYIATPLLAATALTLELFVEPAIGPSWDSPILFDSAVRDALRIDSASGRETAKNVSDVLSLVSIAHPLIDNFFVTWYLRRAPRVAWQMFVINAQAYSLTLALNTITKRLSSRARPWVEGCAENEPELCGSGESYRAFYSGHAAVTATGAGLICAHHTQLSLYQNDLLDAGACVIAVLGTAVTGAMRVASDNRWASDVVVGHLAGYVSGYLLPTLLYYREFRLTPEPAPEDTGPTFAVFPVPVFDGESLQLGLSGIF